MCVNTGCYRFVGVLMRKIGFSVLSTSSKTNRLTEIMQVEAEVRSLLSKVLELKLEEMQK